jgi:hypothetical protein
MVWDDPVAYIFIIILTTDIAGSSETTIIFTFIFILTKGINLLANNEKCMQAKVIL